MTAVVPTTNRSQPRCCAASASLLLQRGDKLGFRDLERPRVDQGRRDIGWMNHPLLSLKGARARTITQFEMVRNAFFHHPVTAERFAEGLRKAGMPEE